jgi:hypothetical protein
MKKFKIRITRKDLYTLFKIYRRTIAYALMALVLYSLVDKVANNFATEAVFVANQDLVAGTIITEGDLKTLRIPISGIAPNRLGKTSLVGQMLSANITMDEQFTSSRVLLADKSETNQRVVGIRIVDSEIATLLKPGAKIDVVRMNNSNGVFGSVIAQDVVVVALAAKKSSFGSSSGLVVMVTTSNENAIKLAINSGEKLTVLLH